METILTIVLFIGLGLGMLGMAFCVHMLGRTSRVGAYRMRLIQLIADAARDDIKKGKRYEWRWEYYDRVSFDEMVNKFWRPLDSWYPNTTFIEKRKK